MHYFNANLFYLVSYCNMRHLEMFLADHSHKIKHQMLNFLHFLSTYISERKRVISSNKSMSCAAELPVAFVSCAPCILSQHA
jgi:hypothetical protein